MANRIPVKAIYSGSDVTSLGEFVSGDTIDVSYIASTTITGAKLVNDTITATQIAANAVTASELADNAVDTAAIAADAVTAAKLANSINTDIATGVTGNTTANAALPKAGGTMTGDLLFGNGIDASFGAGAISKIYSDGSVLMIEGQNQDTEIQILSEDRVIIGSKGWGETFATFNDDGAVNLYYDNVIKINTTSAGATLTGNLAVTGTVDGVDIQTLNTTANAALPKAGGTMTGDLDVQANITADQFIMGDNQKIKLGNANDLEIYHDGGNSYIKNTAGWLNMPLTVNGFSIANADFSKNILRGLIDGAVEIYHNGAKKIETTANGVTVTGGAVGTMTTDNDGSFAMSASNNFKCTPAGNFALTFTAIVAQSGNILFINSGGHTISAHANTKVDANLLATISTAGTYLLAYFSDGTNVYMTNSAIYT